MQRRALVDGSGARAWAQPERKREEVRSILTTDPSDSSGLQRLIRDPHCFDSIHHRLLYCEELAQVFAIHVMHDVADRELWVVEQTVDDRPVGMSFGHPFGTKSVSEAPLQQEGSYWDLRVRVPEDRERRVDCLHSHGARVRRETVVA
jgi:hypothetical protein